MPNQELFQSGYKPANLIVLHDTGAIIKNFSAVECLAWWKDFPACGKSFMLDGSSLKDLANMLGIETAPLKLAGKNGRTFHQDLSHMTIPIGNLEIEDTNENFLIVDQLFAKIENGVLHLAAAFKGEEFVFSSHGGSFDISWTETSQEAAA
ncbi:MAG: hypothetical protein K9K37_07875 [Desulfocapsa sp.]|nr:hypothetical protein [Desulfocapsa sp.]